MLKVKNYKKNVHVLVQLEKRDLKQKSKVKKKKKKKIVPFSQLSGYLVGQ